MRRGRAGVVLSMLLLAAAPAIANGRDERSGRYQGRTSQDREITFRIAGGRVTGLRVAVNVVCPSRRVWQVSAALSAPIKIAGARFHQTFRSRRAGAAGTATVTGTARHGRVIGTVTMRRYIAPEHHYCSGRAAFALKRRAAT